MNDTPYEIISAPGSLYIAPEGEDFPELGATPAGNWKLVGTSGDMNYLDSGISVSHPQTVNVFRGLGSTAPTKAFRSEEDLIVKAVLADLSLEQYSHVLNENTVDVSAGIATIGLSRGTSVARRALLVRFDVSPYRSDGKSQYEIPVAIQQGQPDVVFRRGSEPAALALEFRAMRDPEASSVSEELGRFIADEAET